MRNRSALIFLALLLTSLSSYAGFPGHDLIVAEACGLRESHGRRATARLGDVDGVRYILWVEADRVGQLWWSHNEVVYYKSTDCSGTPYLMTFVSGAPLPAIDGRRKAVTPAGLLVSTTEPGTTVDLKSEMDHRGICASHVPFGPFYDVKFGAASTFNLNTHFVEPFRVK